MFIPEDTYKHKGLRQALIAGLKEKGISDVDVLRAIGNVPRHFFMDTAFLEHAYEDKAFAIGEGQTISQPYTVAFQTELLEVTPSSHILEIGTGSGYQACILLEMGARLTTIEYNEVLHKKASRIIQRLGYQALCVLGDGSKGYARQAPYDRILVTAGAPAVPVELIEQLKIGGILVIPAGDRNGQKMLKIIRKEENKIIKKEFGDFVFVPLLGAKGWKAKG